MDAEAPPSLDGLLGELESEDLFRLRDMLREIQAMPGWERLEGLVEAQRERMGFLSDRVKRWQPSGLDGLIQRYGSEGHAAGYLRGLEEMASVVDKVERLAARVERALDAEATG